MSRHFKKLSISNAALGQERGGGGGGGGGSGNVHECDTRGAAYPHHALNTFVPRKNG